MGGHWGGGAGTGSQDQSHHHSQEAGQAEGQPQLCGQGWSKAHDRAWISRAHGQAEGSWRPTSCGVTGAGADSPGGLNGVLGHGQGGQSPREAGQGR